MSGPTAYWHVLSATLALAFGTTIFLTRRGTARHRKLGYCYIISMLTTNLSALLLYARTGLLGPFHIAAMVALATLIAGSVPAILRRPAGGWLPLHWEFMSWSFVGLVAAAAAEAAFRIPGAAYWPSVGSASAAVLLLGGYRIYRSRTATRHRSPQ